MEDIVPYDGSVVDEYVEVVDAEHYDPIIDQAAEILEEIGQDLESALNYIRQYQRALDMFAIPDPNGHGPQLLLQKYKMNHQKPGSIAKAKIKELKAGNDRSLLD